jgi:hypothetical protein
LETKLCFFFLFKQHNTIAKPAARTKAAALNATTTTTVLFFFSFSGMELMDYKVLNFRPHLNDVKFENRRKTWNYCKMLFLRV